MGEASSISPEQLLIGGMLGMFILSISIVVFFVVYQRRLFKQQQEHLRKEADYQQKLLRANFLSQEKERNRIGKDLHDEVGAMLTTTKLYFGHLEQAGTQEQFQTIKEKTFSLLDQTMTTVRRVSHDLRPVVLEKLGLVEAIFNTIDLINQSGEIKIDFHHEMNESCHEEFELNWYRIVQELTHNTIKHASAKTIEIHFSSAEGKMKMLFKDDGIGFEEGFTSMSGLGMQNIQSRLQLMHGEMDIQKPEDCGIQISLSSTLKPHII